MKPIAKIVKILTVLASASILASTAAITASATWMSSDNVTTSFSDSKPFHNDSTEYTQNIISKKDIGVLDNILCTAKAEYSDKLMTDKVRVGISCTTGWERYVWSEFHQEFGPIVKVSNAGSFTSWDSYYGSTLVWRGYVNV